MKNKKIKLVVCSALAFSLAAGGVIALNNGSTLKKTAFADEMNYKLTIDKMSERSGGKVTAKTALGNEVKFSYNRFDTRPGDTDYNNCICFYKVDAENNLAGGYIKNDTALYGIKTIKIFGYSPADPTPSTLATSKFKIYYGYESVLVEDSNDAYVTIDNGTYTFADGFEPSFIAIQNMGTTFDTCVSKVEISYKCEEVVGDIATKTGPAFEYNYVGKEFTTSQGRKVAYNITERAPWKRVDLYNVKEVKSDSKNNTGFSPSLTIDENGAKYVGYYNGGMTVDTTADSRGRNILSITLTPGTWGWGGACFYLRVTKTGSTATIQNQIYNNNGVTNWKDAGGEIYDTNGYKVKTISDGQTYTFERDYTEWLAGESISSVTVWSGYDADDSANDYANVPTNIINDITFKANYCGHSENTYEEQSFDAPNRIYQAGDYILCGVCGEIISGSNLTGIAPVLRLTPNASSKGYTKNGHEYALTGGSGNLLQFDIPNDLEGRTNLAISFACDTATYESFYLAGAGAANFGGKYQFFSADYSNINYAKCSFVKGIGTADETTNLNYNATTFTQTAVSADTMVTVIFDLTDPKCEGLTSITLTCGANHVNTYSVELRTENYLDKLPAKVSFKWDNWNSNVCDKTSGSKFTVKQVEGTTGIATLGNFGTTYKDNNFPDLARMVRRLKFKMIKDLENPSAAGVMQWYFKLTGGNGNDTQMNITNASASFAQKSNIHLLDMDGNMIEDGTKISNNTYYYVEMLFDAENMSSHIQISAEGVTGENPWGYGYFVVEDFSECLTVAGSSFAK